MVFLILSKFSQLNYTIPAHHFGQKHIQFYDYIYGENSQYIKEFEKYENHNQVQEIIAKARKDWKPKFDYNPICKWVKRAKELVKENNHSKLMFKFSAKCFASDLLCSLENCDGIETL